MWCVRCVKRIMYSLPLANVLALSQGSSTQSFKVVLCINQTFTFFVKGAHQLLLRPPLATSPPLPLPPSLSLSLSLSLPLVCVCVCVCVCLCVCPRGPGTFSAGLGYCSSLLYHLQVRTKSQTGM